MALLLTAGAGLGGIPGKVRAEGRRGIREFEVVMERYKYTPSIFRVRLGDRVRFNLRTNDVMHGFYVSGYDLNVLVHRKDPKTLEFTADRAGVFPVKCSVICGPMHPIMQGKLVVEPNYPFWLAMALGFLVPLGVLEYLILGRARNERP